MIPGDVPAPDFTLDVANGPPVVLSEIWRQHHLLLWFSRGLACPFCRRQMIQFGQIQDQLLGHDTVAVQITPTELETARSLLPLFPVAWPYVSDPGARVAAAYGIEAERRPLARITGGVAQQSQAWGLLFRHPGEPHPEVLPAVASAGPPPRQEGGLAIVDRRGRLRFRQATGSLSLLPSNDQLLRAIRQVVAGEA